MGVDYDIGETFKLNPDITFRKFDLYQMNWPDETDLEKMTVCAARYGGPMAIVRDINQFVKITGTSKPIIRIFTASGQLLSAITWSKGNLLHLGWSESEELLCIQDDGLVVIYDMFGNYQHTFSMGQEAKDTKLIGANVFSSSASTTGIAVMTTNFRILLFNNIKNPIKRELPEMPKSILHTTSWATITENRNTFCLVARQSELFKLGLGDSVCSLMKIQIDREYQSIVMLSVSFNNQYLAVYTNRGTVWLGSSDLKTKFCEFDTGRGTELPKQIEWIMDSDSCQTSNAVIITYPSLLLVVTVAGDVNLYSYDPFIFLIPEMDGVRVLTNSCMEMIEQASRCVTNIFAFYSQEPSCWLFEAYKKFFEKSHKSDEYLCLIKDNLSLAVEECVKAAGYQFDTDTQKNLIRAAHFGKAFIPKHDPSEYIQTLRILKVLNALRNPKIGIPLTLKQFNHLNPDIILDRLIFRKHYGIAIHIAKHLKLPESRILEHWAFHKVNNDSNDQEVAQKISKKFKNPTIHGVSFCNIAKKALEIGRKNLAIQLLEMEPKSSLRVPLLLKLGENKKALFSATQSGDTDLVYTVLLQLKKSTPLAEFQMIIRKFPMAQNLYKKYCQLYSESSLEEIYKQEDDHLSLAEIALRENIENGESGSGLLSKAIIAYKSAHKDIESELCEEARKVLKVQQTLEQKHTTTKFSGLTVHAMIKALLNVGDIKQAEKLKNEFKIQDRRYWWLRIQVMASNRQWEELEKFSKLKKSPIGYEPFVEVCLNYQNVEQARRYIPRCRDDKKIKWLIKAGLDEEAATLAYDLRDTQTLWTVHMKATKSNNKLLVTKLESYIAQLTPKK